MKNLTEQDVLQAIREQVESSPLSLRGIARYKGIDAGNLCRILNGERPLSDTVAEAFGFECEEIIKVFRKKAA